MNRNLFSTTSQHAAPPLAAVSAPKAATRVVVPPTNTVNEAGGRAYLRSDEQALTQIAVTGCFNGTYYVDPSKQLEMVKELAHKVSPECLAKVAVYARTAGHMKDAPAALLAILSTRDKALFERAFPQVIDNMEMVRHFVQMMRSGELGRKCLGYQPKRLIAEKLNSIGLDQLFRQSVGTPSVRDILRMVHPKPESEARAELFRYFLEKPFAESKLPPLVQQYERLKRGETLEIPNVPREMLDSLSLPEKFWVDVAKNANWQNTRKNLNTYARHGVFKVPGMTELIAERLRDPELIATARVFPYQLFSAYLATKNKGESIPPEILSALQDASEIAVKNVPAISGRLVICGDVSGSMHWPVTGNQGTASTSVRNLDVASLFASALLRGNLHGRFIAFKDDVVPNFWLNGRDAITTNAEKIAAIPQGGTAIGAPLRLLNRERAKVDMVVIISDNESWADPHATRDSYGGTSLMHEWRILKERNPEAKLVCLDISPNKTSQVLDQSSILNIGGFSDQVFTLIGDFASGRLVDGSWMERIEEVRV